MNQRLRIDQSICLRKLFFIFCFFSRRKSKMLEKRFTRANALVVHGSIDTGKLNTSISRTKSRLDEGAIIDGRRVPCGLSSSYYKYRVVSNHSSSVKQAVVAFARCLNIPIIVLIRSASMMKSSKVIFLSSVPYRRTSLPSMWMFTW